VNRKSQFCILVFHRAPRAAMGALLMAVMLVVMSVLAQPAPAQTFQVLYNFPWGMGGGDPLSSVTVAPNGNLYGTTFTGGTGYGMVYRLNHANGGWLFSPLYDFQGGTDGSLPETLVTVGPDGNLYAAVGDNGTGCGGYGCGMVFQLRPHPTACQAVLCFWTKTVLYSFEGGNDGWDPTGSLIFDQAGNIYGQTYYGGPYNYGTVFKLTPTQSGWVESVLYSFTGGADGSYPGSLNLDQSGNLFGVAAEGGAYGYGTVFELSPSGSGWRLNTLYTFTGQSDSGYPLGLVRDQTGNLYGVTIGEGCSGRSCPRGIEGVGPSTVFMLSQGNWTYSTLYDYEGLYEASISIDSAGNLYVAVVDGGAYGNGYVFELAHGTWTYTDLHHFDGTDGSSPTGVTIDSHGTVYGTTSRGGPDDAGVIFEITP